MQGKMKNIPARDRIEDDSTIALGVSLFAWLLHQLGLVEKERRIYDHSEQKLLGNSTIQQKIFHSSGQINYRQLSDL